MKHKIFLNLKMFVATWQLNLNDKISTGDGIFLMHAKLQRPRIRPVLEDLIVECTKFCSILFLNLNWW